MLAPQSHSGFYKTTITKCFLAFSVLASLVLRMPFAKYRDWFAYNLDDIFENGSLWRLFLCKLAFLNTKDLICGGLLLYYFRIFERRYGPRKFLSYLFYCATATTVCELSLIAVLRRLHFDFHILPSGPYNVIFPFFVPYFLDIPWFPIAHVIGIPITGKSFPYLFGLQMATTSPESLFLCVCGLFTGLIYERNLLSVQSRWLFPERIVQFGSQFICPLVETPPPKHLNKPLGATLELQHQAELDRRELQFLEARRAVIQSFALNAHNRL
ncbi:Ubiquitin-associated domain-containing protein 2 [Clonorchis sinensis]|uniref:Ubiquitin-associated domain-containing protein 2 n=1 Tax=Clonorchis sinensis TaxID=79923 RepID=A0A8T1MNV4_CLOSI|nr:Ubiquitin-associated domain-containing protein 2 [Clonorchis sinensis]